MSPVSRRASAAQKSGRPSCAAGARLSGPRTSCPAASAASAMCEPMNPAAPVMRMRMPVPNHAGPAPGSQRDAPSHLRKGQSRYAGIIVPVMLTDVILPCLNEAAALPWVLERMPPGYRAIVADNGSDDGSAQVAEAHGAQVVPVPQRGFGAACHGGLLAAT